MTASKLNILPVPTFSRLGVNYVSRDTEGFETSRSTSDITEDRTVTFYADDSSLPVGEVTLNVGKGVKLKLVQVFDRSAPYVSKLNVTLDESAELELVQLYIGGSDTVSEIVTELAGARSKVSTVIGCALDGDNKLDINLIARHRGRKSESVIDVSSVLKGQSVKTFKGTIDFINGSSGAKGSEHEDALLLDNRVRNRTVPVILCEEENVEGSHGATIGRLDERHIFYLRSRGTSEEKIYELMSRSKLMKAVGRIGDEAVKARVYKALGWGDTDE
ncbi:MAG: SufD family Fe-S cluster assembly protein [Ruminococcus sp.]|nr:SufD family Fe-S cluster assembly protein [Ruminococcus sp.]